MPRLTEKGKRFEKLINKADEAYKNGYYVETISLVYSLFEERTYAFLDMLDVKYNKKQKLAGCLGELKKAIQKKTIGVTPKKISKDGLCNYISDDLLKDKSKSATKDDDKNSIHGQIDKWRKDRNDVIHDLAKGLVDYAATKEIAESGYKLFKKYTALIMRVKKLINSEK